VCSSDLKRFSSETISTKNNSFDSLDLDILNLSAGSSNFKDISGEVKEKTNKFNKKKKINPTLSDGIDADVSAIFSPSSNDDYYGNNNNNSNELDNNNEIGEFGGDDDSQLQINTNNNARNVKKIDLSLPDTSLLLLQRTLQKKAKKQQKTKLSSVSFSDGYSPEAILNSVDKSKLKIILDQNNNLVKRSRGRPSKEELLLLSLGKKKRGRKRKVQTDPNDIQPNNTSVNNNNNNNNDNHNNHNQNVNNDNNNVNDGSIIKRRRKGELMIMVYIKYIINYFY
jgi:hypothetical protein